MDRKLAGKGCAPFWELMGPHVTHCGLSRGLPPGPSRNLIHTTVWPQYMGQIWRGCICPPLLVELGPHLTQCGRSRGFNSSVPSFILIHPTAWPQFRDRQDRKRSDSIRRTANRFTNGRPKTDALKLYRQCMQCIHIHPFKGHISHKPRSAACLLDLIRPLVLR